MRLATDLAFALDPCRMAETTGIVLDPWQARVLRTRRRRVAILAGRQVGKSTVVSYRALHTALYQSNSLTLVMGRALKQARELFAKIKASYSELARHADVCPVDRWSQEAIEFRNGSRILCVASDSDTLRGYTASGLVICDESAYIKDQVFEVITPMFAVTEGTLVLLSTAGAREGYMFETFEHGDPDVWEKIRVPATECPRISGEFLEQERRDLGDRRFRMEYLCEFGDRATALFRQADLDAMHETEAVALW